MIKTHLNGYHIYHSFLSGFMSIGKEREHLNRINVFPVADGDTGNNLVRTIKQIVEKLESHRSASKVLNRIAHISMESARGNSGLIFSQYLNGLAMTTDGKDELSLHDFARATQKAVEMAYQSMETPVEGTILTVLNAWSDSIYQESKEQSPWATVFEKAFATAKKVLHLTKEQLPVLKENDVLDAGAMGVVSFLEGVEMMRFQGPVPLSIRKTLNKDSYISGIISTSTRHKIRGELTFRYCTEVLLDQPKVSPKEIKAKLVPMGDSLIINQGKDRIRIHIHSNEPYNVVNILRKYGKVSEQKADDMLRQEQVVNDKKASVAILTDSIADIPLELLDQYQIHVIPLKLTWDEEDYLDRITITPQQFYKMQQQRRSFPGSTLPDEKTISSTFQYLLDYYEHILVLPVGKALSGTWNQMRKVAEKFNQQNERIRVIDTCLNSVAQGLLVQEIARKAVEGTGFDALTVLSENLKKRVKIYVSVSTFKYMVKGGRVSPLKGFIAQTLNIKPIVSLDETGKGKAMDKAFSRKQLMKKISLILKETHQQKGIDRYGIVHAAAPEKADEFARMLQEVLGKAPEYISSISPIVGMHSGKGALAIGVIERK